MRNFTTHHAVLAVRHFGTESHTASNIERTISDILAEYNLQIEEIPVTIDHGSNIVAALKNSVRLD